LTGKTHAKINKLKIGVKFDFTRQAQSSYFTVLFAMCDVFCLA